ncbi:hypothetical protein ACFPMF_05295 [Larkinella bovis]|uniref:Uncharacterized protein n=1 Tax=Larkinella bovis TaxID=683041 RepID=A0ABW0I5A1_9BACT
MKRFISSERWSWSATQLKFIPVLSALFLTLASCGTEEVPAKEKNFDGVYTVQEVKTADNYLLTVAKKADKANTVTIANLANLIKTPLEATISGHDLIIREQGFTNYLGDQYTVSGQGEMVENTLILRYTLKGHNGYTGSVFARKQGGGN